MKHIFTTIIFAMFIAFLTSCSSDSSSGSDTYTVYTYTGTYEESWKNMSCLFVGDGQDNFQDFGGYDSWDKFEQMRDTYGDQVGLKTHSWTESDIKAHLLTWGFTEAKAQAYTEKLLSVEHGLCYVRQGDLMNYLIK